MRARSAGTSTALERSRATRPTEASMLRPAIWKSAAIPLITIMSACNTAPPQEKQSGPGEDGPSVSEPVGSAKQDVVGNIDPNAIQIDGSTAGADLFANVGTPLHPGATLHWGPHSSDNTRTNCLRPHALP